jgi:hypothetical protein
MLLDETDKLLTSGAGISNIRAVILRSVESNRIATSFVALADESCRRFPTFMNSRTSGGDASTACFSVSSSTLHRVSADETPTDGSANQFVFETIHLSGGRSHFPDLHAKNASQCGQ